MSNLYRWATADEAEEQLNGDGIPGAVWVITGGSKHSPNTDLAVPNNTTI